MSKNLLAQQLKALFQLQLQKNQLNIDAAQFNLQIDEFKTQLTRLEKLKLNQQDDFAQQQNQVSSLQQELDSLSKEEQLRRTQLDSERRSDAIHSLSITVNRLERERKKTEELLEEKWLEMDRSKKQLETLTLEAAKKIELINIEIATLKSQQQQVLITLPAIEDQIMQLLTSLPEEIKLHLISMSQGETGIKISPLINDVCGSCFYPLTNRDLASIKQLRNDLLMACKNCFTVIYIEPDEDK